MCNLNHPAPTPLQQSGAPDVGSAMNAGPANPATGAPAPPTMVPTKFSKLLKVVIPLATGAGIGATGGNWRVPGSGSAAAGNFFAQQNAEKMQKQELALRTQQDSALAQERQDQGQLSLARIAAMNRGNNKSETRSEPGADGKDHDIRYTYDAQGNVLNKVDLGSSKTAPTRAAAPRASLTTGADNQRMLVNDSTAEATPITTKGGVPMEPEQSPVIPGMEENQPEQPEVPVMAPPTNAAANADEPKPRAETSTDEKGVSRTQYRDMNPRSPTYKQIINTPGSATRQPSPSRKEANAKPKPADIEAVAQEALKLENGDGTKADTRISNSKIPDGLKAAVRNRIREIKRPGQPKGNTFNISPDDLAKLSQVPR